MDQMRLMHFDQHNLAHGVHRVVISCLLHWSTISFRCAQLQVNNYERWACNGQPLQEKYFSVADTCVKQQLNWAGNTKRYPSLWGTSDSLWFLLIFWLGILWGCSPLDMWCIEPLSCYYLTQLEKQCGSFDPFLTQQKKTILHSPAANGGRSLPIMGWVYWPKCM